MLATVHLGITPFQYFPCPILNAVVMQSFWSPASPVGLTIA